MQNLSTSEASVETLPSLFEKAQETPIVVTNGQSELGAIVSMEDYMIIHKEKAARLIRVIDNLGDLMRKEAQEKGISLEELESMLDRHNL